MLGMHKTFDDKLPPIHVGSRRDINQKSMKYVGALASLCG